jgi:hypothetical protein
MVLRSVSAAGVWCMRLFFMSILVAWTLALPAEARGAEAPVTKAPTTPKKKRHRHPKDDALRACREKCERDNMNRDCADEDGNMTSCPCDCD